MTGTTKNEAQRDKLADVGEPGSEVGGPSSAVWGRIQFLVFSPWGLACLALACYWLVAINHLRVEWTVNSQYSFGWAVPVLCLGLLWRRASRSTGPQDNRTTGLAVRSPSSAILFFVCALLLAPTRLIEEANPEWRLISWLLTIEVVGLSLLLIYFAGGPARLAQFAFPICFFCVAVPWPMQVERPLIQCLTWADAAISVELLKWLGTAALQHGNVIEVGTGIVGIDEACSGIRSFQASLMISLFLGELYRLTASRRIILCLAGFLLAFAFNVGRTVFLVSVAANRGTAALSRWHDPAGVTILVACLAGLWAIGVALRKHGQQQDNEITRARDDGTPGPRDPGLQTIRRSAVALLVWLVVVEVGVDLWYRVHEWRLPEGIAWSVDWPRWEPTYKESEIPERARESLRYDEGVNATWRDGGSQWQVIYLRWRPGRVAAHLARSHSPSVCLTAAGKKLVAQSDLKWFSIHGIELPFRSFLVEEQGRPVHIFYCLWEDRAEDRSFRTEHLSYRNRFGSVLAGRRNLGQRSLEIAAWGIDDPLQAEVAAVRQLARLIRPSRPLTASVKAIN